MPLVALPPDTLTFTYPDSMSSSIWPPPIALGNDQLAFRSFSTRLIASTIPT